MRWLTFAAMLAVHCLALGQENARYPDVTAGDDHVVILAYHHVAVDTPASTSISPGLFTEHMDLLEAKEYTVLSLEEVLWRLDKGKPFPGNSVALTFDDAYVSVYENAWPILQKRGWPFSVFVSTDYIDRGFGNYMNWDQLRELSAAGALIANHSVAHASALARGESESLRDQLDALQKDAASAAERIRAETGVAPRVYAWPYGEYNDAVEQVIADLGWYAVGQQSGPAGFDSSLTAIPRFPVSPGFARLDVFEERLNTEPLPLRIRTAPDRLLRNGEPPTVVFYLDDERFNIDRVNCFSNSGEELKLQHRGDHSFAVTSADPLPAGRSKYTCTAPHNSKPGVFGWYSHLWVVGAAQ